VLIQKMLQAQAPKTLQYPANVSSPSGERQCRFNQHSTRTISKSPQNVNRAQNLNFGEKTAFLGYSSLKLYLELSEFLGYYYKNERRASSGS
jgi:hypothetical protein